MPGLTAVLYAAVSAAQPNIVMFFVDDLGYGDLGFTGHPTSNTPNIDRLAQGGKVLTSWYSAAAVCSASRTALLTGRQPPRVGMPGVINSLSAEGLPLNETTVADYLKDAGYATMAIGKWHQGQQLQYLPLQRGFDAFLGLPFSVDDGTGYISNCSKPINRSEISSVVAARARAMNSMNVSLGPQLPLPLIKQVRGVVSEIIDQPTDLRPLTSRYLKFAKSFVTNHTSINIKPMFLYLAFSHVHTATPNINPASSCVPGNTAGAQFEQYAGCDFVGRSRRGRFGDALDEVDWMVGSLVEHLKGAGVLNNTLILFTSDNGPWLMKDQSGGSAGIFTGRTALQWATAGGASRNIHNTSGALVNYANTGKGSTWEGGIRQPAFAYWCGPGRIDAHSRSTEVISTMDVLPTALALAGADHSTECPAMHRAKGEHVYDCILDGKDMRAILFDDALPSDSSSHRHAGSSSSGSDGDDDRERGRSQHQYLFFYNSPHYGNVSRQIYAVRFGKWKAHFITSKGLVPGTTAAQTYHDPPLLFDVEGDPSEAYPVGWKPAHERELAALMEAKAAYEASLFVRSITPAFGRQYALCCDVNCTCNSPTPLPIPLIERAAGKKS